MTTDDSPTATSHGNAGQRARAGAEAEVEARNLVAQRTTGGTPGCLDGDTGLRSGPAQRPRRPGASSSKRHVAWSRVLAASSLVLVVSCSPQRNVASVEPTSAVPLRSAASLGPPAASPLLDATRTVADEAFSYPSSPLPQVVARIVTIAPGQTTGWHRHDVPTFGYLLSGRLEVEYAGLGRKELKAGDSLIEAMRVPHNGTNLGTEPVRILVVFMGAQGKPAVVKTDPPAMPAGLGGNRPTDLVELSAVDPRIRLDLRYATDDNFTGHAVYRRARALMQRPAAAALRRVDDRARAVGYGLMVLDAYRPWSVTRMFWDDFPMHRAYLADPLEGSRHNRGCAVDLTLFDLATGKEVKMPSGYDDFSERAHPAYAGGSAAERKSRDLLRQLMEAEGFTVYDNEWWHFDYAGWQEWPVLDVPFESPSAAARQATPAP